MGGFVWGMEYSAPYFRVSPSAELPESCAYPDSSPGARLCPIPGTWALSTAATVVRVYTVHNLLLLSPSLLLSDPNPHTLAPLLCPHSSGLPVFVSVVDVSTCGVAVHYKLLSRS